MDRLAQAGWLPTSVLDLLNEKAKELEEAAREAIQAALPEQ
ncbi:MAG: hypothetical protein WBB28_12360 [Crinalium sp.]